ncbi:MAG: aspartate carbamoyltransferase [Candidatus Odinarchaeia archaeon]
MEFKGRDIISIRDFSRAEVDHILNLAANMEELYKKKSQILAGKVLANLFFEPSTRTRLSFEVAMKKLGGDVIGFSNPLESSIAKGESLSDTVQVVENYADVIVLRHKLEGAAKLAAEFSTVPVINAGSGAEEHPTQALLDLFTIKKEKGKIDGLNIALMGDLKYGRAVRSLAYALSLYNVKLFLISPKLLSMREEVLEDLKARNIEIYTIENLNEVISDIDVLYLTRIQRERIPDATEYERVKGSYKIDVETIRNAQEDLIIMHPLPRVDEIDVEVDNTSHAVYFKQVLNGVFVRMAILGLVLGALK